MKYLRFSGLTLIELMIVVVVIGLLAAFSYPSYRNWVTQTRRSDAQIALTQIASQQEKYFTEYGHYAVALTGAKTAGTGPGYTDSVLGLTSALSPDGHYAVSVVAPTAGIGGCPIISCFNIIADPNDAAASTLQKNNGKLRLNSLGVKQWDKANDASYSAKWTDK